MGALAFDPLSRQLHYQQHCRRKRVPHSTFFRGRRGLLTLQYIAYFILAAIIVALLTFWYLNPLPRMTAMKWGIVFGASGLIISILTMLVSGITGVLAKSGSLEDLASVLQNFEPFLSNLAPRSAPLCFWVFPATLVGCAMRFLQIRPSPSVSIRY